MARIQFFLGPLDGDWVDTDLDEIRIEVLPQGEAKLVETNGDLRIHGIEYHLYRRRTADTGRAVMYYEGEAIEGTK